MHAYSVSTPAKSVELDHEIPIGIGGATSPANLWPSRGMVAREHTRKDKLEKYCMTWYGVASCRSPMHKTRLCPTGWPLIESTSAN